MTSLALARLPGKDPISAWTHFVGLAAGIVGLVHLVTETHTTSATASLAVYGATMVAVFLASTTYHFFDLGPRGNGVLRRLDHAAIYLFIAGTYVPILTHLMEGAPRVVALSVVSGLAVVGVLFKLIRFGAHPWVDIALYIGLGWVIVPFAPFTLAQFSGPQLIWLMAGGVAYTIGAVIDAAERPDPWPGLFGFHEIWHLFVLLGAGAHFGLAHSLLSNPPSAF